MNKKIIKQSDYQTVNFNLKEVKLHFKLNETHTCITNIMTFNKVYGDIYLDGIDIELVSIAVNNKLLKPSDYKYDDT